MQNSYWYVVHLLDKDNICWWDILLNDCNSNRTFVFKENNLFKEDIRKYLENDEAIDSIDYLIELKNNMCNNDTNLLHFIHTVIIT